MELGILNFIRFIHDTFFSGMRLENGNGLDHWMVLVDKTTSEVRKCLPFEAQ